MMDKRTRDSNRVGTRDRRYRTVGEGEVSNGQGERWRSNMGGKTPGSISDGQGW
jgi:hypothetical protein